MDLCASHVLYHRLEIDIGVLCDFMDNLCGALLFAMHLQKWGHLHGLTLPKSWIVRHTRTIDQITAMRPLKQAVKFVAYGGILLHQLFTGIDAGEPLDTNLLEKMQLSDRPVQRISCSSRVTCHREDLHGLALSISRECT